MWKRFIQMLITAATFLLFSTPGLSYTSSTSIDKVGTNNLGFFLSDITDASSPHLSTSLFCNPDSGRWGVGGAPAKSVILLARSVKKKAHNNTTKCNRLQVAGIVRLICQGISSHSLAQYLSAVKCHRRYYLVPFRYRPLALARRAHHPERIPRRFLPGAALRQRLDGTLSRCPQALRLASSCGAALTLRNLRHYSSYHLGGDFS